MTDERAPGPAPRPEIGLCSICRHAHVQESAKGSVFWRCRAADEDPRLRRYPPLPVSTCPVFSQGPRSH